MREASENETLPVREARNGAPEAWRVLLQRFRLPLYAYVFELVRHEQTTLDIVQETFINAARHLKTLQRDEKFGSWLFNIAHQKCVQHRRKHPVQEIALEPAEMDLAGDDPGPRETLIRKEQEEEFMNLLTQLPVSHRAVLLLFFVEEFSLEEIARITGSPVGTVKSRLHYARQAFRKIWEARSL